MGVKTRAEEQRREPRSRGPNVGWGCDSGESLQEADTIPMNKATDVRRPTGFRAAGRGCDWGESAFEADTTDAMRRGACGGGETRAEEQGPRRAARGCDWGESAFEADTTDAMRRRACGGRAMRAEEQRREPRSRGPNVGWGCDSGESLREADTIPMNKATDVRRPTGFRGAARGCDRGKLAELRP